MMPNWYERAEQELERDLEEGRMTLKEFNKAMRELRMELEESAARASQEAYDREMYRGW
jgi:hypothetical protein